MLFAGRSSFDSEKDSADSDVENKHFPEGSSLLKGHALLVIELPTANPLVMVVVAVGTKLDTSVVGRKTDNLQSPPEVRIVNSTDASERPFIVFQYAACLGC